MVWVAIGWMAGIALGAQALVGAGFCALAAMLSLLLSWRRALAILIAVGLGLTGGYLVHEAWAGAQASVALERLAGQRVTVYGSIAAEPSYDSTNTRVELAVEAVEHSAGLMPTQGRILVTLGRYPIRRYGDRLAVTGLLRPLPPPTNTYARYLASRRISGTMAWVEARNLPGQAGSRVLRWLYTVKEIARDSVERVLPEPEAGLLSGILLGLGHTLPEETEEAFRRSGLTHVIVISGFNIGLVLQQSVLLMQGWASRRVTLLAGAGVIVLYTLFVGPSPPVTRAALMSVLVVLAELMGRKPHVLTSLAWASVLMTAVSPALVWDVSFQLSMVSTLALIGLTPVFDQWTLGLLSRRLSRGRSRQLTRLLSAYLLSTCAAQLLTFPIIWYHFQEVSLVALPANLLALPAQPSITMLGGVAALLGCIWEPLGRVAGWLAYVPLWWTVTVARTFAGSSWAGWPLPAPAPWVLAGFYAAVGGALLVRRLGHAGNKTIAWVRQRWSTLGIASAALLVVLALATQLAKLPDGRLHVHVFDVGQGDGLLIRTPGGMTVLVDGGPDPLLLASRLHEVLPLWERRIDLVVATHADSDHLAGLVPLPRRHRIGAVLQPPAMSDDVLAQAWEQQLRDANLQPIPALRGQTIELEGGVALHVLHPGQDLLAQADRNENSVVLLLTMGEFSMLLTGDIEEEAERELLHAGLLMPVTVLKIAHHGAPSSTGEAFLAACRPQIAVVSVGAENRVGHPSPTVLERLDVAGASVLRTDEMGTIELVTDGERMWTY